MLFKTRLHQLVLFRKHHLHYSAVTPPTVYIASYVLRRLHRAMPRIRQQNVYLYRRQETFIVLSTAILKYIYNLFEQKY